MRSFSIQDIKSILPTSCQFKGNTSLVFDGFKPILESAKNHISWIRPNVSSAANYINNTRAGCILCNEETFGLFTGSPDDSLFVITNNPLLSFVKLLKNFENMDDEKNVTVIHPTAVIHPGCKVGTGVKIGAYSIIDDCTIGDNTVIDNNVRIFSNVVVGKGCHIREFCSIGGAGFGIVKDEEGNNIPVPHIGRAVIGDNVLIFPFTNVDRGTLGDTVVENNVVIDHYCHIGHNTHTGKNTIITAGVILAGGAKIKNDCFIGVNSVIREKIEIGSFVTTAMGAIITKNVPDNETWIGNPAIEINSFIRQRDFLKKNS
jgi:UDP-3-O-[3-hydroxymyristoyl] glucosamine N-acyltransferase LpxD